MRQRLSLFLVLAFGAFSASASAQEWTRFRGPNGSGVGKSLRLPDNITAADYRWQVSLPGIGHASPTLWGKKLFVTSSEAETGKRHLLCLDSQNGKTLWRKTWDFKAYHRHEYNSFASSSPTVDSESVFVVWSSPEMTTLYALDHFGKERWKADLGAVILQHGGGNSPILVEDTVIIGLEQEGEGATGYLFGFDKKTGERRWRRERKPSQGAPYATPLVYKPVGGSPEVLFASSAHGITSLNPRTGSVNWETPNLFPLRCVASPILLKDMVLATCGSGAGDKSAVALRLAANAGAGSGEIAFRIPRGVSYVPTPIWVNGRLFFWCDNGIVACYDGATGKEIWRERAGGNVFGSPVSADGKIYAVNTRGELAIIAASDTFKLLGKHSFGEASHATPAIANGALFVRTESRLFAIGGKNAAP